MRDFLKQHSFLLNGEKRKYWWIDKEKKSIQYFLKANKSYKITDPEELVRAEFFMELIEKYQYDPKDIEFEREMPQRVPNFYADIVVNEKGTDKPFLVIECKRVDITDAEFEQAVKQGAGNARVLGSEYFGTVAGESRRFFITKNYSEKNPLDKVESDCPVKYNKPEVWRYKKGDPIWELATIDGEGLKSILDKCHQTIWQGGKRNPGEAFSEVAKVIFVKVFDEKTLTKPGKYYQFQRKSGESVANVKKRIDEIYNEAKKRDPEVFSEDIRLDAQEITTVVEHLQKISLNKTDLDVKGEAFQKFMGNFFKGDFGQYFTPPPTVQFCLDLFKHEIDDSKMVIDPACGSGGFLLKALDTLREQANESYPEYKTDIDQSREHFNYWHGFAENKLFGCEISESIARVAKMNMILHDDGHTNVIANDSLEPLEILEMKNKGFKKENFDFIFTNPPFGATIRGSEKPYLEDYSLASKTNSAGKTTKMKNQKTEILFIERCWQFLKDSGKMVIVLPDGILTNSSLQYVRDWILDHFKLLGVVSLPQDAFRYYGAGVKSSILILEKGNFSEDYPIFMAQPEQIGIDSTGRPCRNDLDEVVKNFWEFQKDPIGFQKKKSKNLENNFFIVNKVDILEWRIDPEFFHLERQEILQKIENSSFEKDSFENIFKFENKISTERNGEYLGLENIISGTGEVIKNKNPENYLTGFDYTKGQILFPKLRPYLNKVYLADHSGFCSTEFHVLNVKNPEKNNINYLFWILSSQIILKQTIHLMTGNTLPRLQTEDIKNLKIPLPPLEIQKQIAEKMDKAFAVKKEKEQEAEEILASIEPYLLGELGIDEVEEEKEKEMIFTINLSEIKNNFSPIFNSLLGNKKSKIYEMFELKDFAKLYQPKTISRQDMKSSGYKVFGANGVIGFYDKYNHENSEVLVTCRGATCGEINISEPKSWITGNAMVIQPLRENIDKNFLAETLKVLDLGEVITGSAQPQITRSNLENFKIPVPDDIKIQQKISAEISARREKAKKLREEAEEVLAVAKREVENIILGK